MPENFITVKFGRVPGPTSEFNLNGERNVRALLAAAQCNADGFQIIINDNKGTIDSTLRHGDTVLLTKKIQGN